MYQNNPYYQNYNIPQYQMNNHIDQNQMYAGGAQPFLKGKSVVSIDEARAAQVDFDGSVFIFPDITNGYIYKLGFTAGGINTIAPIINKYKNIKVGTINLIINIIILLIGCFQFGIKKLLYAIVVIIINSILINLVMYGRFLKRKQ